MGIGNNKRNREMLAFSPLLRPLSVGAAPGTSMYFTRMDGIVSPFTVPFLYLTCRC